LCGRFPACRCIAFALTFASFHSVEAQSSVNLMTFKNLAVVFGPTLMRSLDPDREFLDMGTKNGVVEFIIQNTNDVFATPESETPPSSEPLLDINF
jgi:hypothetical protein